MPTVFETIRDALIALALAWVGISAKPDQERHERDCPDASFSVACEQSEPPEARVSVLNAF